MFTPEVISIVLEFLGSMLIGIAVLRVHSKVGAEHKIDNKVLKSIRRERKLTITGMLLITVGFIIHFL